MSNSRLIVRRKHSFWGRRTKFKVLADYEEVGDLKPDSLLDVELPSGTCDIQIQLGSNYSQVLTIELRPHQTAHVSCRSKEFPSFLMLGSGIFGLFVLYKPLLFTFLAVACFIAGFKLSDDPVELQSPQAVD